MCKPLLCKQRQTNAHTAEPPANTPHTNRKQLCNQNNKLGILCAPRTRKHVVLSDTQQDCKCGDGDMRRCNRVQNRCSKTLRRFSCKFCEFCRHCFEHCARPGTRHFIDVSCNVIMPAYKRTRHSDTAQTVGFSNRHSNTDQIM